jgi:CRP-like cAMP-binding protein
MFIVLDGTADADVDGNVVASYGPGDYFGEMSVLDGGPRSATVTATSALTLAGLAAFNLRGVVVDEPSIAMHLIEVLTRRLRAANATDH